MSGERLADQAYTKIVEFITGRSLRVGDRLPSELHLADMIGVSRTSIREALVRLSADGVTESRRGAGSYVKNRPSDHLLAYTKNGSLSASLGTYEVRFVVESEAARLAAIRRSAQDLLDIDRALKILLAALSSGKQAHVEDMDLHRRIVAATANPAFLAAFEAIADDVDRTVRAGLEVSRLRPPEIIEAMKCEHQAIVEAIRDQDGDAAALAMRWHLAQGRKRVMP